MSTSSSSSTPDVLIVGGGIGGLTLALSCHQAGISARVFEAAPEIHALGVGINLLPHGMRELSELGLVDNLAAHAIETPWYWPILAPTSRTQSISSWRSSSPRCRAKSRSFISRRGTMSYPSERLTRRTESLTILSIAAASASSGFGKSDLSVVARRREMLCFAPVA